MACPVLFTITTLPVMDVPAAMMRDGKLIYMMERKDIERREAAEIAFELKKAFEKFCGTTASAGQ